jgi:hypothetical protein
MPVTRFRSAEEMNASLWQAILRTISAASCATALDSG